MSHPITNCKTALTAAVGAASTSLATSLAEGKHPGTDLYRLVANANLWWKQDLLANAQPTASAGAGSVYLAAGRVALIDSWMGGRISVIQDGASTGTACIARVVAVR